MYPPSSSASSSSGSSTWEGRGSPYQDHSSSSDRISVYSVISEYASSYIQPQKRPFVTSKLQGVYQQPWLTDPRLKSRKRNHNAIVYTLSCIGIVVATIFCWTGSREFKSRDYCLVLDDSFKTLDPDVWNYEVQVDGFGNGQFDWTTTDPRNVFVDHNGLRIVPTLTNESTTITNDQLLNGYTLNLTRDGTCTSTLQTACGIKSSKKLGTMIPPVRSGRINTKGKKGIRFGKVEVEAKLPSGDWLWPAIWMMPKSSAYGTWPASGEIDIMESRGNDYDTPEGGKDYFGSTLHWGPNAGADGYWRTFGTTQLKRSDFSKEFHTFGLEWTEDYLVTYVGNRIHQVMYIKFEQEGFWHRGEYAKTNATEAANPWRNAGVKQAAPFDEEFFLILNVAVGASNGYFKDSPQKPWIDRSGREMQDFWKSANQWYPTWGPEETRGMTVRRVRMWQEGKCQN
ncbi:hypothetical protein H072_6643 [Dactylellina haptotyla CBS 200.50]|uniref:GH16 domain-containing protein n=1 Tax=Dactylellina haptotyla (strain CBS 200.50) TaxID=1284197 RepID=S8BJN5_DACHA|nr:hypothetical protein H072_6643 [Dactylellina haptotyla CBS 200.50]